MDRRLAAATVLESGKASRLSTAGGRRSAGGRWRGGIRPSDLSFENRLTLVIEKGSGEWKRTMQLYSVRNQIAHGTLLSERIDVSSEIQDFFRIQSSLARD